MTRQISIILPTFNRPQFINRAVQAILDQDYDNWELIIQNGGEPLSLPYDDPRIKLFNEKDTGITDAMNKGFSKATGDIFTWANDDDEMNLQTLSFINENLISEWGYGLIEMTDGTRSFTHGRVDDDATLENLKKSNFVPQPAVFWTRKAYETVGKMDETHDFTSDYEYWLRLWTNFEPQKWDRLMAFYHLHADQITQKHTEEQLKQSRLTAQKYK